MRIFCSFSARWPWLSAHSSSGHGRESKVTQRHPKSRVNVTARGWEVWKDKPVARYISFGHRKTARRGARRRRAPKPPKVLIIKKSVNRAFVKEQERLGVGKSITSSVPCPTPLSRLVPAGLRFHAVQRAWNLRGMNRIWQRQHLCHQHACMASSRRCSNSHIEPDHDV